MGHFFLYTLVLCFLKRVLSKISPEGLFPEFIESLWSELPSLDQKLKDFLYYKQVSKIWFNVKIKDYCLHKDYGTQCLGENDIHLNLIFERFRSNIYVMFLEQTMKILAIVMQQSHCTGIRTYYRGRSGVVYNTPTPSILPQCVIVWPIL